MQLERSERYQAATHEVRRLPQTSESERKTKQEQARLLRMQFFLAEAQCAKLLSESLEEKPFLSADELRKRIVESELVTHPEVAESFIQSLIETRAQVQRALEELKTEAKTGHVGLAKLIYRWVLPPTERSGARGRPRGKVWLGPPHPLALVIITEDQKDYDRISPGRNSGGFYNPVLPYPRWQRKPRRGEELVEDSVPLIVIRGQPFFESWLDLLYPWEAEKRERAERESRQAAWRHEVGHAQQDVFKDALDRADRKLTWLRFWETPTEETLAELETQWLIDPESAKRGKEWQLVLDYAWAGAKDELLAALKEEGQIDLHLADLKEKDGQYDYFKELGLPPETALTNALWEAYRHELDQSTTAAQRVLDTYRECKLLQRTELMTWVLARIPLSEWPEQLERTLFLKEAEELAHLHKQASKKSIRTLLPHLPTRASRPSPHPMRRYYRGLMQEISNHQAEPLLPFLKKVPSDITETVAERPSASETDNRQE